MRLPFTRRRQNSGIYGGFGSKASEQAWQPSAHANEPGGERVPKRYRRLRLRRLRRPGGLSDGSGGLPGIVMMAVCIAGFVVGILLVLDYVRATR